MMYEVVIYARLLIVCLYDHSWGNPGPIFLRFLSGNLLEYLLCSKLGLEIPNLVNLLFREKSRQS